MKKLIMILILLLGLFIFGNEYVVLTEYEIYDSKIEENHDGINVVFFGDFHNKFFIDGQYTLLKRIKESKPDLILITGDMIESKNGKMNNLERLIKNICGICPIYYVLGNSEIELKNIDYNKYELLISMLERYDVKLLINNYNTVEINNSKLTLVGTINHLDIDPLIKINNLDNYIIALNHYPYSVNTIKKYNVNLLLTGHNHGGEVIVPFVGGLYCPDLGFFPKFDYGKFDVEGVKLVITRGLASNGIPKRINNLPEVVKITLHKN